MFRNWFKRKKNKDDNSNIEEVKVEEVVAEESIVEEEIELVENKIVDTDIQDNKIEESKIEDTDIEETSFEEINLEELNIDEENVEEMELEEEVIDSKKEEDVDIGRESEEKPKKGFSLFDRLKSGLNKTRKGMVEKIDAILKSYSKVDDELFDELEEILVTADVGINTTMKIIDRLRDRVREEKVSEPEKVKELLKLEIKEIMTESISDNRLNVDSSPSVILVVGVNGVGKTTTIGKLSYKLRTSGKKVIVAAGDTFRAAAIEQLEEWSKRSGTELVKHSEGADPAAVIYDGIQATKSRKADVLICDTAGRLHNKKNLMNELNKIFRVIDKEFSEANKEVLLVLDATTGQNAINQAKEFKEVCDITGVALTKLDGTAKGGIVIAIESELGLPVKLIGVGEKVEDLQEFNIDDFVNALFN